MTSLVLESCCTSLDEALAAQDRGADRIELCSDLSVGGLTPPRSLVSELVARLKIPVNVLVRPLPRSVRSCGLAHCPCGGDLGFKFRDFVYDDDEIAQMSSDIEFCRDAGAAGVVIGALTAEGAVDIVSMRRLMVSRGLLSVTFHRAFDVCLEDASGALEKIICLGCDRLLTSGRAVSAWEGRGLIAELVVRSAGRLIIMPGSGVCPGNLAALSAFTGAAEFHGTRIP